MIYASNISLSRRLNNFFPLENWDCGKPITDTKEDISVSTKLLQYEHHFILEVKSMRKLEARNSRAVLVWLDSEAPNGDGRIESHYKTLSLCEEHHPIWHCFELIWDYHEFATYTVQGITRKSLKYFSPALRCKCFGTIFNLNRWKNNFARRDIIQLGKWFVDFPSFGEYGDVILELHSRRDNDLTFCFP